MPTLPAATPPVLRISLTAPSTARAQASLNVLSTRPGPASTIIHLPVSPKAIRCNENPAVVRDYRRAQGFSRHSGIFYDLARSLAPLN